MGSPIDKGIYTQEDWARHNEAIGKRKALRNIIARVMSDAEAHTKSK